LVDVFAIQNEIIQGVFQALSIITTNEEQQNLALRATNNLEAYNYFLQGQALSRTYTSETNEQARLAFQQAINIDPNYGRAYGAMAFTLAVDFLRGWTNAPTETLDRALSLAEQAVALNNTIPQTYWALGYVHFVRKEPKLAESAAMQSLKLAPNYADSYGLLALIYNNSGKPQKALEHINQAMQLNPYYTWDYLYNKARAYYHLNQYEQAIPLFEQAAQRNENVIPIKLMLAATYVNVQQQEDAEWIIEQILMLNPATTLNHVQKSTPIVDEKTRKKFLSDLQKAGLPD
jgi:adenylate cyclase